APGSAAGCRRGSLPDGCLRIDAVGTCALLDHRAQPGGETLGALVVVRGEARILGVHTGQHHLDRAGALVVAGDRGTVPLGEPAGLLAARGGPAGPGAGRPGLDPDDLLPDL